VIDDSDVASESFILQLGDYNGNTADTEVPEAEATFPEDESEINSGVYDISGSATDDSSGVDRVLVRIQRAGTSPALYWNDNGWADSAKWHEASFDSADSTWNLANVDLTVPADYRVLLRAFDNAGNHATAGHNPNTAFTVLSNDNKPPEAETTSPDDISEINSGAYQISGSVTDDDSGVNKVLVRIQRVGTSPALYWNDNAWTDSAKWLEASLDSAGSTESTWSLANVDLTVPADYRVLLRAFDNAGNHATAGSNPNTVFTVLSDDDMRPEAETTSPASDIDAGVFDISGSTTDDVSGVNKVLVRIQRVGTSLYWNDSAWTDAPVWLEASLDSAGSTESTWTLANVDLNEPADYRVLLRAFDNAGNHATARDNDATVFTVN